MAEAIYELERLGGPGSSQHILIADANTSRGLEISPKGNSYIEPDVNGVIVHTNHFIQNKYVEEVPWLTGSVPRLDRIKELLGELLLQRSQNSYGSTKDGKDIECDVSASLLRNTIFSDRQGRPQSICCCMDEEEEGSTRPVCTLFNIIMTFIPNKAPKAEVLFGKPGEVEASNAINLPWL